MTVFSQFVYSSKGVVLLNKVKKTNMSNEQNELLNQIRLGEDSVLEFKTVNIQGKRILGPHRNSLADELAAMANTCDGICILGVDDKTKEIEGIPVDKLDVVEDYLRQICN